MSILETISARHSYRGKYLPTPVPREDLRKIMEAGLAAPSGCNKQTTSLIAVDDPAVLTKLHAAIDPPIAETAPAIICVLTRRIIAYRDRCYAVQDTPPPLRTCCLPSRLWATRAAGMRDTSRTPTASATGWRRSSAFPMSTNWCAFCLSALPRTSLRRPKNFPSRSAHGSTPSLRRKNNIQKACRRSTGFFLYSPR